MTNLIPVLDSMIGLLFLASLIIFFIPSIVQKIPLMHHPEARGVLKYFLFVLVILVVLRLNGEVKIFDAITLKTSPVEDATMHAADILSQHTDVIAKANATVTILSTSRPQHDVVSDTATAHSVPPTPQRRTMTTQIVPVATATTIPRPIMWYSGMTSQPYAPHAGEICWGAKVGKFVNGMHSYIAYFPTNSAEIVITNGACERQGRSFDQIVQALTSEMNDIHWVTVRDYNTAAAMPDTVWWESGVGQEAVYAPHAGEICWGQYVGKYRQTDVSFIVAFKTESEPITIFNGKCELYGRTLDNIAQDLRNAPELVDVQWVVIDDYRNP